ncbi:MAG: substrate-binding domain-containing protein [Hydrogenophaga sp.]|jgi:molybdate transport repressor ModE-like protein|uniref:helix-turn-helix transcriptional regulator n=1 Tax=Hydrogenophaga sp. TaxID=1904254 RepID=UPI001D52F672|nr:substrate-binding domain-containing protein [Hydrogenophaga sp.]MBW0171847.1 helix-turn-helix transcriptional regulator [Hydrogenophaga sp.]MBW0186006.1 helix-turn-helix transcriptional regulator [Hydrogenophaga sp.]
MPRITLSPQWRIDPGEGVTLDANTLLGLLAAVQASGSISQGGRELGLSYRHAWGLLQQAEQVFGQPLLVRGRGRGSALTELGEKLIWADARIGARLQPLLESLASELEGELGRVQRRQRAVPRLHASHGFAVAALREQLAARQVPVELRYRSSLEAVAALAQGDCELAGFHVPLGEFEAAAAQRYLPWLQRHQHRLVQLAVRTQGLFVAAGNPLGLRGLRDLTRRGLRFVNRPEGSGTRVLTDLLLQREGIAPRSVAGYDNTELTHAAVAAYVASGMADVGIGVQTAAHRFGLHFIPLLKERYFFALPADALERAELRPVLTVLRSPAFRARVAALKGYEAAHTGQVMALGDAFG